MTTFSKISIHDDAAWIRFGNWKDFCEKLSGLPNELFESEQMLCEAMDIEHVHYRKIIEASIRAWRHSPSRSLFHSIAKNGLHVPVEGSVVFEDLLQQTRFLMILGEEQILSRLYFSSIWDDTNDKLHVGGEHALTCRFDNVSKVVVEKVLQSLYLYQAFCKKKEESLRLPKKLYRGVRFADLNRIPELAHLLNIRDRVEKFDGMAAFIQSNSLHTICQHTHLLSFSASQSIANYFTDDCGFVIEIDSENIDILTSELHDVRLSGCDRTTGKKEKEYIVRIAEHPLNITNVYIRDTEYMIEKNDPLAVELFDHDNQYATYRLHDTAIKARFCWTSNTTHCIRYECLDDSTVGSMSGTEFKKKYGFSPVLNKTARKNVEEFNAYKLQK